MTLEGNVDRIARAFNDARRSGIGLPQFPGEMPTTLGDAYAVQDRAIALTSGARIAGWKVGKISPPFEGVDRLAGPIFAGHVVEAADDLTMPIFADGFGAAEAEFLLRIGTAPDPAKTTYTTQEATTLVDAVHVGIEIASSPFPGINDHGPTVTVSDFGNNNGLIVGEAVETWRDLDLDACLVELWINDALIGSATTATMLDGPFGAVRFLLESCAARGIPVEAGQWISTGAVTGVHPVAVGDRVVARFDRSMAVECVIGAYRDASGETR